MIALACAAGPASAQEVKGWRLYRTEHVLVYAVDGTPGARQAAQVAEQLEQLHTEILQPLGFPPGNFIYPLYPSKERFYADWWLFATIGHGDQVYAWGTVYDGDRGLVNPYLMMRAAVAHAFPRSIPLLRWGLGDALGDRAAGVDPHRHLRALVAAGNPVPDLLSIAAPSDFGAALPASYPVAVSFMAYLLDTYGPARTAQFVERVEYRYYDFAELFRAAFGVPLRDAEAAWRRRAADGSAEALDRHTYLAVTRFVYRTTLAGSPARLMLEPVGATVVTEAFRSIVPLRQLNLQAASAHMATADRAEEEADRKQRLTTSTARGAIAAVIVAPILLAVGLLVWPAIRAKLADRKQRQSRKSLAAGRR